MLLHETVIVELGDRHLDDLLTIADPLVVSDLPTLLWSPHGHPEAVEALLPLAQATLLDSVDDPVWHEAIDRANTLSDRLYVVDLAWLRSTPWRERIAATFDPPALRRRARRDRLDHDPPPPRLDGRGDAADRLAGLAAGLAAGPALPRGAPTVDVLQRPAAQSRSASEIALRLEAAPELPVRGLAGL